MAGKKIFGRAVLVPSLALILAACASQSPSINTVSGGVAGASADNQSEPVALYGMPEISLGAAVDDAGIYSLLVCDRLARELDESKPLLLYIDGDYEALRWSEHLSADERACHRFVTSYDVLRRVSDAQRAMLRLYFSGESLDQRITGTVSDYLSRPKMLGPQYAIRRFVDAVSARNLQTSLAGDE